MAEAGEAGLRLDAFISMKLERLGITRTRAQKLIESGAVRRSEDKLPELRKNRRVSEGESFEISLPEAEEAHIAAENIPLDIVYEDDDLIVVNKPKGMVVHPAAGHYSGTLVNALLHHCGSSLSGIGGELRPGIVHRLDKDTSGLIIAAKNDGAHLALSRQLGNRSLSRIYEALVIGRPKEDSGVIDEPVGRHPADRKKMAVTANNSRSALTYYEIICAYRGYTHVRCRLYTGRTHQIRVHMAHIGHPVAGDVIYGGRKGELGLDGQCLHAKTIKFIHPSSGEELEFSTPLPPYFNEALSRLRL
jgi:23S rRNA pseudouridine1911/1915/1917 synthase